MDELGFVRRFVNGDKDARKAFLADYSRLIYSAIHYILVSGELNTHGVVHPEDIFQEFFCSLLEDNCRKLRSFKGKNGCKLSTWLRQVAVNYTISCLRKIKPALSLDEESEGRTRLADILVDDSTGARELLKDGEKLKALKECISRLDIEDRFLVEMNFIHGLGFNELKNILDAVRGAFDMRRSRVVRKLRECFKRKNLMLDF